MADTFNLGIGLAVVVPSERVREACELAPDAIEIGTVIPGTGTVSLEGDWPW